MTKCCFYVISCYFRGTAQACIQGNRLLLALLPFYACWWLHISYYIRAISPLPLFFFMKRRKENERYIHMLCEGTPLILICCTPTLDLRAQTILHAYGWVCMYVSVDISTRNAHPTKLFYSLIFYSFISFIGAPRALHAPHTNVSRGDTLSMHLMRGFCEGGGGGYADGTCV